MDKEQPQAKTEAPVDTAEPVFHDNSNKSTPTGLIVCMVLLVLIAIGGVGFGVWEMVSQSQKVKDLETQVANCAALNDDEEETSEKEENTEDYIYIGEWGLKIKKPENLEYVDYSFKNSIYDGNAQLPIDYTTVGFNGIALNADKTAAKEYLRQALVNHCSEASLSRMPKGAAESYGGISNTVVYEDDEYDYIFVHEQATCSDGTNDSTTAEEEGGALVTEMLTNKNNYSKI